LLPRDIYFYYVKINILRVRVFTNYISYIKKDNYIILYIIILYTNYTNSLYVPLLFSTIIGKYIKHILILCYKMTKKCVTCQNKRSTFNLEGLKAEYCGDCPVEESKNYKPYCMNCFTHIFPDHPKCKNARLHSKELKVRLFIDKKL